MAFQGFPSEAIAFLADLARHNDRDWFNDNKGRYQTFVEAPAKALLEAITPELAELAGQPVGGKIFRIHRDVRFSKDKTPYNTHVRMLFHVLGAQTGGCGVKPAFFFSLEPDKAITGAGSMDFPKPTLEAFRTAVDDPRTGAALARLLAKYKAADGYRLDEPVLKRVPAGFAADHPREALLRHKGLAVWHEDARPASPAKATSLKVLMQRYKKLKPVYDWLDAL